MISTVEKHSSHAPIYRKVHGVEAVTVTMAAHHQMQKLWNGYSVTGSFLVCSRSFAVTAPDFTKKQHCTTSSMINPPKKNSITGQQRTLSFELKQLRHKLQNLIIPWEMLTPPDQWHGQRGKSCGFVLTFSLLVCRITISSNSSPSLEVSTHSRRAFTSLVSERVLVGKTVVLSASAMSMSSENEMPPNPPL